MMSYEDAEIVCKTCGGLGQVTRSLMTKVPDYEWVPCPNQCNDGYIAGYIFTCDICGEPESTEDLDYAEFGRHQICDRQVIDGVLGRGT